MTLKQMRKLADKLIKEGHGDKHIATYDNEWGMMETGELTIKTFNGPTLFGVSKLQGKEVVLVK